MRCVCISCNVCVCEHIISNVIVGSCPAINFMTVCVCIANKQYFMICVCVQCVDVCVCVLLFQPTPQKDSYLEAGVCHAVQL